METCCKKGQRKEAKLNVFSFLYIMPLRFYRYFISPLMGPHCRFEPTCSHYAEEAFQRFGFFRGLGLTLKRLGKCHPWHEGGYDPVPNLQSVPDLK